MGTSKFDKDLKTDISFEAVDDKNLTKKIPVIAELVDNFESSACIKNQLSKNNSYSDELAKQPNEVYMQSSEVQEIKNVNIPLQCFIPKKIEPMSSGKYHNIGYYNSPSKLQYQKITNKQKRNIQGYNDKNTMNNSMGGLVGADSVLFDIDLRSGTGNQNTNNLEKSTNDEFLNNFTHKYKNSPIKCIKDKSCHAITNYNESPSLLLDDEVFPNSCNNSPKKINFRASPIKIADLSRANSRQMPVKFSQDIILDFVDKFAAIKELINMDV